MDRRALRPPLVHHALVFFALVLGGTAPGTAGVARRIADINTQPIRVGGFCEYEWSETGNLIDVGSSFLFRAKTPMAGCELFISDGAPGSTRLFLDFYPGTRESATGSVGRLGNIHLLWAETPGFGTELFRTDGTAAGTFLVKDIRAGPESSPFGFFRALGTFGLLVVDDGVHGGELWRTDGTASGTFLLRDIYPGPGSAFESIYSKPVAFGSYTYFAARDPDAGIELWRTDGTVANTVRVADLLPGPESFWPAGLTVSDGWLYFFGGEINSARSLWRSDGTAAGTSQVLALPGAPSAWLMPVAAGRMVFIFEAFTGSRALWVTDGTAAGTQLLLDIDPTDSSLEYRAGYSLGSKLLLFARDVAHGWEPYVTDGTGAGTFRLGDLSPGPADSMSDTSFGRFIATGSRAVFLACDPEHGCEPWSTDGTVPGTIRLSEFVPGPGDGTPTLVDPLDGGAVMEATVGALGPELYRTDGLSAPVRLTDLGTDSSSSDPVELEALGDTILFNASSTPGTREAWRSDGTTAGTYELAGDLGPYNHRLEFEPLGAGLGVALAHGAFGVDGSRLLATDGTTLTTLADFAMPCGPSVCGVSSPLAAAPAGVIFAWTTPDHGREPWVTDGTAAGTHRLVDIVPGATGSNPTQLTRLPDGVAFLAHNAGPAEQAWITDGTAAATSPFAELSPGTPKEYVDQWLFSPTPPYQLFFVQGSVNPFFSRLLYSYDDANGQTTLAGEFASVEPFGMIGGRMLFAGAPWSSFDGPELWASDGTPGGTELVLDIRPGLASSELSHPAVLDTRLHFRACSPAHGCELWRTNETGEAPFLLNDLVPGIGSSLPAALYPYRGRIYFAACTPSQGCEPWVTDGFRAGTHRLADIAPGAASSLRIGLGGDGLGTVTFVGAGDSVYFPADDGSGLELWAVPVEIFYDGFETGNTARWN